MSPHAQESELGGALERDLTRPDLCAIGVVLVRRETQHALTIWCAPDVNPGALEETAVENGHEPGALLLVFPGDVALYVRPEWRAAGWLRRHLEGVVQGIEGQGLADFLAAQVTAGTPQWWPN